jgi:hypothetical protein
MFYVVERYLPGLSRRDLLQSLARLEQIERHDEEPAVRYLGSTIVLGDEACFCQFEGPSEAAVADANALAGAPFDRIVPAISVTPTERKSPMSVSTSVPTTVEMRRSRLLGLLGVVAALAAGITALVLIFTLGTGASTATAQSSRSASERQFVKAISTLAEAQQRAATQAAFDRPGFGQFARSISSLARTQQAAALRLRLGLEGGPRPALATRGMDPGFERFARGISSLAEAQHTASAIDSLGLSSKDAEYIWKIASSPQEQTTTVGR